MHFHFQAVDGRTIFMRDVAPVHDGFQVRQHSVAGRAYRCVMTIRQIGGRVAAGGDRGYPADFFSPHDSAHVPPGYPIKALLINPSCKRSLTASSWEGAWPRGFHRLIFAVPG